MAGKIHPIEGEPFRALVDSDTYGQPPYLVDLTSFNGNGQCACINFVTQKRVNLRNGEPVGLKTRCKHIRRFRDSKLDEIIAGYKRRQIESNKNQRPNAPHNQDEGDWA